MLSDGEEAAPGKLGEIVIRGDNVIAGYWGRPDASRIDKRSLRAEHRKAEEPQVV